MFTPDDTVLIQLVHIETGSFVFITIAPLKYILSRNCRKPVIKRRHITPNHRYERKNPNAADNVQLYLP